MFTPHELTGEQASELSGSMAATSIAKLNTQLIKRIIPMLKVANIIFFVINHLLPDPSIMPKKAQVAWLKQGERCPGGETAIYLANNLLRFNDGSKLKMEKDGINGIKVGIQLVKSRTSDPGREIPLILDYEIGFDPELSLFEHISEMGAIKGAGAYLYFDGHEDKKFSRKKFKEKLIEDPEFMQIFAEVALKYLDESLRYKQLTEVQNISSANIMINMMRNQMVA